MQPEFESVEIFECVVQTFDLHTIFDTLQCDFQEINSSSNYQTFQLIHVRINQIVF